MNPELLAKAKSLGFSDRQIAHLTGQTEDAVRANRKKIGLVPSYRLVDTCAAEFEAYTPYYYSTYGDENERRESGKRKVMILGGGPNRIRTSLRPPRKSSSPSKTSVALCSPPCSDPSGSPVITPIQRTQTVRPWTARFLAPSRPR